MLRVVCLLLLVTISVAEISPPHVRRGAAVRSANPGFGASYRHIMFKSGAIDTTVAPRLADELATEAAGNENELDQFLVHMQGPITAEAKAKVNAALSPYTLGKYIPHDTFVTLATKAAVLALDSLDEVVWTGRRSAESRIEQGLEEYATAYVAEANNRRRAGEPESDNAVLNVILYRVKSAERTTVEEAAAVAATWSKLPAEVSVTPVARNKIEVSVPVEMVSDVAARLASEPSVAFVEPKLHYSTLNAHTRFLIQADNEGVPYSATHPFFDAGIDGTGVIVGVGDSGLDYEHCHFRDDTQTVSIGTTPNQNHRKVVYYDNYVDSIDETGGHGTHVTGTVLGNSQAGQTGDAYLSDGNAPGAKVALCDMGDAANPGAIYAPPDMINDFFQPAYDAGARIHTNSWGSSPVYQGTKYPTSYNSNSADFDEFMYDNRDFVTLVAAGNDGDSGASTIGAPATAKNIITVGATENTNQGFRDLCCMDGNPVCILTGGCNQAFEDEITAGLWGNENMAYFSSRGPLSGDNRLKPEVSAPGYYTVSSNSNGAPTNDQCDGTDADALVYMAGTSMATPATAGTAALVVQYFEDGYYPTGAANAADEMTPTGSLVKAVLINGAVGMTGEHNGDDLSTKSIPNNFYGYGRINLPTSLYLPATADANFNVVVLSNEDAAYDAGTAVVHCFDTLTGTGLPLHVTLVWTDPPADSGSSGALINDLDLVVDGNPGNGATDSVNPSETVRMTTVSDTQICANVNFVSVPEGPQSYSLIAAGPVTGASSSSTETVGTYSASDGGGDDNGAGSVAASATVVAVAAAAALLA